MGGAFTDLLFWIVIFIVFFFGFRWLQKRDKSDTPPKDD